MLIKSFKSLLRLIITVLCNNLEHLHLTLVIDMS